MNLRIAVERIDPEDPAAAASRATTPQWQRLPPSRVVLVAISSRGHGPGVGVSPWILDGLERALGACGLEAVAIELSSPAARGRHGIGRFEPDREPDGAVQLDVPGARRPRRIPSAWFGRHLCVVVPCTFVHARRRTDRWTGPVASAWSAIDQACGGSPARLLDVRASGPRQGGVAEDTLVGARIAASVFASITLVIDASWWAPVAADSTSPPGLLALDRCLCLASPVPDERWAMGTLERVDAWLANRLRLDDAGGRAHEGVHAVGSAADRTWPRASLGRPLGLAGQAMEALWAIGARRPSAPADRRLPPAVPGPLARHWHADLRPGRAVQELGRTPARRSP